jgi:hypothetical protein
MTQATLAPSANVCVNAGASEKYDTARSVPLGPNVGKALAEIWAVAATTQQLLTLGWQVLFQPEDGGIAFSPQPPFMVRTSDGAIGFYSSVGLEIPWGEHEQHAFPHDATLAAAFFARHATSH